MTTTESGRPRFSFVHIADVHLDTSLLGRSPAVRSRLRTAAREALRAAVDLALDEKVHALLVAGDLFDNDRLSFETERFLVTELRRLDAAGIAVLYATGNHDPGGSLARVGAIPWPDNVTLFRRREPETVEITGPSGEVVGRVTAAGHEGPSERGNLAVAYPQADPSAPHAALLHAAVVGSQAAEAHERYAPCVLEDLHRKGYDYWALGHIHKRQAVLELPPAHYPGNLQGRNPNEVGPKGALLVSLAAGGDASVAFRPLAPVRWVTLRLDRLDEVDNLDDLVEAAAEAFRGHADVSAAEAVPGKIEWMVRLELSGPCPMAARLTEAGGKAGDEGLEALEEEIAALVGALSVQVRPGLLTRPVDLEPLRSGPHMLAEALAILDQAASDDRLLESLAPERIAGLDSDGAEDRETKLRYLRSRLEGLGEEAAARMVDPDQELP